MTDLVILLLGIAAFTSIFGALPYVMVGVLHKRWAKLQPAALFVLSVGLGLLPTLPFLALWHWQVSHPIIRRLPDGVRIADVGQVVVTQLAFLMAIAEGLVGLLSASFRFLALQRQKHRTSP
jgi:hypothetical protein